MILLDDIAQINVGVVLSRKAAKYESEKTIKYPLFNLKIYEQRNNGEKLKYEEINSNEDLSLYMIKKGDLIFRLAFPLKVIIADSDLEGKIISNQYVIIRVNNKKYNAVFLQCFLQSEEMQRQLEKYLVGIAIRTIPVNKIREIHLPEINYDKQLKLAKIYEDWNRQKKLYENLINYKEKYYSTLISNMIQFNKKEENKNERKTNTR